jgi:hypothetical protein
MSEVSVEAIRTALKDLSQNPQVAVGFDQQVANSVTMGGQVGRPRAAGADDLCARRASLFCRTRCVHADITGV